MFSTSIDVLNLVLAACIAVLTFFLCWAIYYFVATVHRLNRITRKIEEGLVKVEEIVALVKEKIKNSSAYFMIFSEIAKQAIEILKNKDWTKKKEKSTGAKKK
jgi:hypothetical protein